MVPKLNKRGSGILLHVTSLPSPYGIGDLGPGAYQFADFLAQTGQAYWQVLPLNPTNSFNENSPYSSHSAFAGNTLLISPDLLIAEGLIGREDIEAKPEFPGGRCDYSAVIPYKEELLRRAFKNFSARRRNRDELEAFCGQNSGWLEDYALFVVLKRHFGGQDWGHWAGELRERMPQHLQEIKRGCEDELLREKFWQYLFFKQWLSLKEYCNRKGIELIGDLPIYVDYDSVDVWTNAEIFKLDKEKKPALVSGVPPDYFSETGQLWGNPVYRWEVLRNTGYKWWVQRIARNLALFDILRLDHFRGFVAFWEVAATEKTAISGRWIEASPIEFFSTLRKTFPKLPIIAEDLGIITSDVREVMRRFDFPGMRVLLFAFAEDLETHPYLPHNYIPNCVVYTGTHDNNTVRGWFEHDASAHERENLFRYLGKEVSSEQVSWEFIRLAMDSAANTVVIPLQEILGLGAGARMNRPASRDGNWQWRLLPGQLNTAVAERLAEVTENYQRALTRQSQFGRPEAEPPEVKSR